MKPLVILRPEPGASATAARAAAMGLDPCVCPLFEIERLKWDVPSPSAFDALLLTSANAVRSAGEGLSALMRLPAIAVGQATAAAVRDAGFADVDTGAGSVQDALELAYAKGLANLLHLTAAQHTKAAIDGITIERRFVYRSKALDPVAAVQCLQVQRSVILIHSARAGRALAALPIDHTLHAIVAISAEVATACGVGWSAIAVADIPREDALLALAGPLCHS